MKLNRAHIVKKVSFAISLSAFFGAIAHAQQQEPPLLLHAAHCLAVKEFLPTSRTGNFVLGYLLDDHSYPGDKVIYLVDFAAPDRSNGTVFAIVLTTKGGREDFYIQNNAGFVLSKHEPIGVNFVDPPLGGDWTQEHIASAIRRIEKGHRFTFPIKDLYVVDSSVVCESYTDPQH